MQSYQTEITVSKDDLDELDHVNNIRYVEWVQEVAKAHWQLAVPPKIKDTCFWVLIKHCIEYKSEALLNDVIVLKTYIEKSAGVKSKRIVEIINKQTQKLIAKSETTWCLMDSETKRLTRITPEITNLFR
ncbi:thioesterase [Pseudalgibacter alginicilyticus]|uniref:Thioesterase n=1 Tax=Pseudalgibacter alginicilyticus TaxID=1736674 RepID=A0A0P0CLX7_9FLAO|nr:acyl-CoA thioesterase [Pseudalgibacter alginicilyticus]ALJ03723.1 thioesterase [Pseudalgibacter alginicilyticus]